MNKFISALILLITSLIVTSCDKDIQVNDDYKNISIVYGLINPNDSVSYIRIEKAFLSNGDIYQDAQVADSNIYPYKLDVKIYSENRTIEFDTITIYNKNEGVFYAPKMTVYYAVTKGLFNTNDTYYLEVRNPKTGDLITSSSKLIDGSKIRFDYPNFSVSFVSDKEVTFKSIPGARLYQLNVRFHYTEGFLNNGDTIFSQHYVDWIFPTYTSRELSGGEDMLMPYVGAEFFSNLKNNIPIKPNVFRYIGQTEFILSTADDIFNIYMDVNKPSTSIVIDRPTFTNIENGYGIFASRSNGGGFYNLNLQTQLELRNMEDLNFVQMPTK